MNKRVHLRQTCFRVYTLFNNFIRFLWNSSKPHLPSGFLKELVCYIKEIEQMNVKLSGCWAIVSSRAALIHTPRKDWSWYDFTMLYQQGTLSLRASTYADFIQNYFLWKCMFCNQNFREKGILCTITLFLAPFGSRFEDTQKWWIFWTRTLDFYWIYYLILLGEQIKRMFFFYF